MPLAIIYCRSQNSSFAHFSTRIAKKLPGIITKTLSVPTIAPITKKDVEVRLVYGSPFDVNTPEVAIQVFANAHREREINLKQRTKVMCHFIKKSDVWQPSYEGHVYVWVMLTPASFVQL